MPFETQLVIVGCLGDGGIFAKKTTEATHKKYGTKELLILCFEDFHTRPNSHSLIENSVFSNRKLLFHGVYFQGRTVSFREGTVYVHHFARDKWGKSNSPKMISIQFVLFLEGDKKMIRKQKHGSNSVKASHPEKHHRSSRHWTRVVDFTPPCVVHVFCFMLCEDFMEQCKGRCFKSDVLSASIKTYPGEMYLPHFDAIFEDDFYFSKGEIRVRLWKEIWNFEINLEFSAKLRPGCKVFDVANVRQVRADVIVQ